MSTTIKTLGQDLGELVADQLKEAGKALAADLSSVQAYAAERLAHLSTCVGDPDFAATVTVEAHNVALTAAGRAIDQADAADARILGIVQGALAIGAKAIAIAV